MSTPPSGFRATSLIVSSLLLVALVAAIALAIVSNPRSSAPQMAAAPTATDTEEPTASPGPTNTQEPEATHTATSNESAQETAPAASTPTSAQTDAGDEVSMPAARIGEQRRVEEGGFAFLPVPGYSLEFAGDTVTLSASGRSGADDLIMILQAQPSASLVGDAAAGLEDAFSFVIDSLSERQLVQSGEAEAIRIDGEAGLAGDIVNESGDAQLSGRIALVSPEQDRLFLGLAFAPGDAWDEAARADFDAVLGSVEFFPPVSAPGSEVAQATPPAIALDISATGTPETEPLEATPTATAETAGEIATPGPTPESPFGPESEWRIASNGNFANQIASMGETFWAATDGGVVAWNKESGSRAKYTTLDGLSANRAVAAENCGLPGLGMLFASNSGLQVFDTQSGSWKTLDSGNSPMSYDDVAALYCDVEAGYVIVAYTRHGLDIFDAETGEWTLVDENDGLEYGIIREIAVTPPRTIWIASQLGLTRYGDGESTLFNVDNSPMTANPVTALATDGEGAVWLATAGDLYRTDGENWQSFNRSTVSGADFPNGSITGLAVAEDGTVWVGSDQTQVCRFDAEAGGCVEFFSNEDGMAIAPLTSMRVDEDGIVYYTTAGAGVSAYDGEAWSLYFAEEEPIAGNRIRDLASVEDGSVWVATNFGASQVGVEDGSPLRSLTAAESPLLSQDVRVAQPVAQDSAWLGTAGGAHFYDDGNWQSYTLADGLAGVDVRALAIDGQNRTWLGTGTGLSIWTGNGFFNLTTENGLPSDNITTLLSADELVWIGTDAGLLRFQDNQLQVFNTGNINLPSNAITDLALDADGSLLIGTDSGLARFRENRIVPVPDIPSQPITGIAVGEDGLAWVSAGEGELYHFDGTAWIPVTDLSLLPSPSISELYVDENGDLWIGSDEGGLAIVSP